MASATADLAPAAAVAYPASPVLASSVLTSASSSSVEGVAGVAAPPPLRQLPPLLLGPLHVAPISWPPNPLRGLGQMHVSSQAFEIFRQLIIISRAEISASSSCLLTNYCYTFPYTHALSLLTCNIMACCCVELFTEIDENDVCTHARSWPMGAVACSLS